MKCHWLIFSCWLIFEIKHMFSAYNSHVSDLERFSFSTQVKVGDKLQKHFLSFLITVHRTLASSSTQDLHLYFTMQYYLNANWVGVHCLCPHYGSKGARSIASQMKGQPECSRLTLAQFSYIINKLLICERKKKKSNSPSFFWCTNQTWCSKWSR